MVWLRMKIYTGIISKGRLLTDVIEIQDYFHIGKFYRFREWSSTVQPVHESDEILIENLKIAPNSMVHIIWTIKYALISIGYIV